MTRRVQIRMNVANALQWLGTLYRSPADAIKEHVSNAIDEHLKTSENRAAPHCCTVVFRLRKRQVEIAYPYGMTREEFEVALHRVADSAKRHSKVAQVGQLGIGIFSFQQIGKKCTFFSRKGGESATIRVTLREGSGEAEIQTAHKRDWLEEPGIRILISDIKFDPTKPRGPLAPEKLTRLFADRFASYLEKGQLAIQIWLDSKRFDVSPPTIDLPRIARGIEHLRISGPKDRRIHLSLFFDPSGKGTVGIRHAGVVVVDSIGEIEAHGLEESIYATGFVKGWIDADFLAPLPARTGFDENEDWTELLVLLDRHRFQIGAEVEQLKQEQRDRELSEVQRQAVQLAREILDLEDFRDLELPSGLSKAREQKELSGVTRTGETTGEQSAEAGDHPRPRGLRIGYREAPFPEGSQRHSKFTDGTIQANTLNPDYQQETAASADAKLAYATLLIGKEAIAFNDKTGATDDQLERLLSFYFSMKRRLGVNGSRKSRPRKRTQSKSPPANTPGQRKLPLGQ